MGKYLDWLRTHNLLSAMMALVGIGVLWVGSDWYSIQYQKVENLRQQSQLLQKQIDELPKGKFAKDKLSLEKDLIALEKDRLTLENAISTSVIQSISGLLLFVTAWVSIQNLKATQQNVEVAQEKQVTERFTQAINQLGSEKLEIRLGGIYALERIARDSPKDHWTIMEVLTSFIQEKSPLLGSEKLEGQEEQLSMKKIPKDVQAALTVIGRRESGRLEPEHLNLMRTNLSGAILIGEVNLSGANLSGANLSGAFLGKANFSKAILIEADLSRSILIGANLSGADLTLVKFSGADLGEVDFREANLKMADLSKARNLDSEKIELARNYKAAFYSKDFQQKLGLTGQELIQELLDP